MDDKSSAQGWVHSALAETYRWGGCTSVIEVSSFGCSVQIEP